MFFSREWMIFVSHGWKHNRNYWMLIDWLLDESNFICTVPKKITKDYRADLTKEIVLTHVVVVLADMYYSYRTWIDYAISEGRRMNKPIVVVSSCDWEAVPESVEKVSAVPVVDWNKSNVLKAVNKVLTNRHMAASL